jgi:hypothetical protein
LPAAAAGPANGAFGIAPAPSGDGIISSYFQLTVAPGHSVAGTAIVTNLGQTTEQLKVGRPVGVTASNGGSAFNSDIQRCGGPSCWLTGLPGALTLPGGTRERVPFTVSVPSGATAGQYLAGIAVEHATASRSAAVGSNGNAKARSVVIQQAIVAVAITVGSLSQLTTHLRIPGVSGAAIGSVARLNIALENTGQTFARATGEASCTAGGQRHSFTVLAATIRPRDQAVIPANAPGLPMGATVPCTIRLGYGKGLIATWSGPVTVPGLASGHIVHTGPGTYSVVPASGIPSWVIALFVIGGLALVTMAVLLVRTRRQKPAK